MTIRAKLAQFKELAHPEEGSNYQLADDEAVQLVAEIGVENCRHAEKLAKAILAFGEVPDRPAADAPDVDFIAWAVAAKRARDAFWHEFQGEPVDGLTIIRKR